MSPTRMRALFLLLFVALAACGSSSDRRDIAPTHTTDVPEAGTGGPFPANDGDDAAADSGVDAVQYDIDCPKSPAPSASTTSPRILIIGPASFPAAGMVTMIAQHLQGMLAGDVAFTAPTVTAQAVEVTGQTETDGYGGSSLMNYFYFPSGHADRLELLAQPWSYVVFLESALVGRDYPELYFEGVRVLGCRARAAGAKPIVLMTWSNDADAATRGDAAYRVANGTQSIVAPAGYAWDAARAAGFASTSASSVPDAGLPPAGDGGLPFVPAQGAGPTEPFVAAASLYTTLTGRARASRATIRQPSRPTTPRSSPPSRSTAPPPRSARCTIRAPSRARSRSRRFLRELRAATSGSWLQDRAQSRSGSIG